MWLQRIGLSVGLVLAGAGGGVAAAQGDSAGANGTTAEQSQVARPVDAERTAALLGRLHRAAQRETQLGDAAEGGAASPETRVYGADLKEQFRSLDNRVMAFAAANGIPEANLDRLAPGENVVAMRQQVDNLTRLANARGPAFDRDFWVALATEQAATSDALAATLEQEPALAGIVSDFSSVLDSSSRRASVAAEASAPATTGPPSESAPPLGNGGR